MCEPISATLAIVAATTAVAGTVVNHNAQHEAAKVNKREAKKANEVNQTDLSTRALEEKLSAQQQIDAIAKQGTAVQGTAAAVAGANGVAGNSVDALLADIGRQESAASMGVRDQLDAQLLQVDRERAGANANTASRIASVPPPNPWATGLTIAGQAIGGANAYIRAK